MKTHITLTYGELGKMVAHKLPKNDLVKLTVDYLGLQRLDPDTIMFTLVDQPDRPKKDQPGDTKSEKDPQTVSEDTINQHIRQIDCWDNLFKKHEIIDYIEKVAGYTPNQSEYFIRHWKECKQYMKDKGRFPEVVQDSDGFYTIV